MSTSRINGFIRYLLYYILAMMIIFLIVGVLYREYSKALIGGGADDVVVMYYLSLSHGHILMMGVITPLIMISIPLLAEKVMLTSFNYNSLKKPIIIYIIGSLGAVALLVYKGIGIIYYYSIYSSLQKADEALFLSNHALRESLYGLFHLLLGIGIVWYVLVLYRFLRGK